MFLRCRTFIEWVKIVGSLICLGWKLAMRVLFELVYWRLIFFYLKMNIIWTGNKIDNQLIDEKWANDQVNKCSIWMNWMRSRLSVWRDQNALANIKAIDRRSCLVSFFLEYKFTSDDAIDLECVLRALKTASMNCSNSCYVYLVFLLMLFQNESRHWCRCRCWQCRIAMCSMSRICYASLMFSVLLNQLMIGLHTNQACSML